MKSSPTHPATHRRGLTRLIVISPEADDARELRVVGELFAAGLSSYHVRKPHWTRTQLASWIEAVPRSFHSRLVLHAHHDLAATYAMGGIHYRDQAGVQFLDTAFAGLKSRAVHSLQALGDWLDARERLLFSSVFPSISKPGYGPGFDPVELRSLLARPRRAEVIALGGVDGSRIAACRDLGFDGIAVLGAIWQATDPLRVFGELQTSLHDHAY